MEPAGLIGKASPPTGIDVGADARPIWQRVRRSERPTFSASDTSLRFGLAHLVLTTRKNSLLACCC
jgi:hypothetical protein